MVSQVIATSPAPSLRNQPAKRDCSWVSPNCVVKYKIRKVRVVRDFPKGCGSSSQYTACGQNERLASQVIDWLERPNIGDLSDSNNSAVSSGEERFGLEVCLEGKGFENPNDSSGSEPSEISKEGENQMIARVYPPRRKISAVRCFPVGFKQEVQHVQARGNETSGSNDLVSIAKDEVCKEEVKRYDDAQSCGITTSNCGSSEAALEETDENIKCLNNVTERNGLKLKRFANQQQLLNSGSRNQLLLTEQPIDIEIPVQRLTVQGLMAGSRCPFRKKRAARNKTIRESSYA